jgi:hypothetical protein
MSELAKKRRLEQHLTWEQTKVNLESVHEKFCAIDQKWEREKDAT